VRKRIVLVLAAAASLTLIPAPPAQACEFEGDPACHRPCGDRVNQITQKLYGKDLITCPW